MRPIRLTISGINSFKQREELDFTRLCSDLFCIYGDTGSGKTTILDSIILALYGEYNRSDKIDFLNLDSKVAEVEFEFAMEGNQYKVWREFSISGSGGPKKKVKLYKNGNLIASQPQEANEILLEVIGINKKDFTHVIALEQGKFGKFLSSTRKERTEVVCNLFHLEKYKDLFSKANELAKENEQKIENLKSYLQPYNSLTKEYLDQLIKELNELKLLEKENDEKFKIAADKNNKLLELKKEYEKSVVAKQRKEELENKILNLKSKLEQYEKDKKEWDQKRKAISEKKQSLLLEQSKLKVLEPRLKDLEKIQSDLNNAREKYQKLLDEKNEIQKQCENKKLQNKTLESNLRLLKPFLTQFFYFDNFDEVKAKAEAAVTEFKKLTQERESLISEKQRIIEKEKRHQNLFLKYQKDQETFKDQLYTIKNKFDEYKKAYEEYLAKEAAQRIIHSLKEGDTCPVCGGIYQGKTSYQSITPLSKEKLDELENKVNGLTKTINDIGLSLKQESTIIQNLENQKIELNQKIEQKEKYIDELNLKNLDDCNKLLYESNKAYESNQKLNQIVSEINVLEAKLEAKTTELNQLLERGKELKEQEQNLKDELGEEGLKAKDRIKEIEEELIRITEEEYQADSKLNEALDNHNKTSLLVAEEQKEISLISQNINDISFDPNELETAQKEYNELLDSKGSIATKQGIISQKIAECENGLNEKQKKEKEILNLQKTADLLEELKKLLKGDRFLEFVADEYIRAFSEDASIILNDVSAGKFSLIYDEGEFFVIDYLSGGKKRKAKTLSGGETFIASLSLAIAIARHVSQKSYDLFFLDEGFGTLDPQKLDMVTQALMQLSRSTMVGVISHRSELVEQISARIKVEAASFDVGSKIIIEH